MSRGRKLEGSKKGGSRIPIVQVLEGWKAGEVFAMINDPSDGKLVAEVPLCRIGDGDILELRLELRSKWIKED